MSTPIIEDIAANVLTTLNGVTTAAGYNQTLTVYRPRRVDFSDITPGDLVGVVYQIESEEFNENKAQTSSQWRQKFRAEIQVISSDTATETIDTRCNQVAADIMKALMVDAYRGKADGSVIDTMIDGSSFIHEDGGESSGVIVDFSVIYRTKITSPYQVI
jgi:hypothetical protein